MFPYSLRLKRSFPDAHMHLTVENLAVTRGGREVLSGVSFGLSAGEALLLTGPNGAGKTTLLRSIAGLLAPSQGRITFTGSGARELPISEHLHFIGHQNAVKSRLSVTENLQFWATMLGGGASTEVTGLAAEGIGQALDRLELSGLADIEAGYLSAGQRRRVALARLLVAKRPIWLLDEPTVSLDAASVAHFSAVVDTHVAEGGLVIAATHIPLGLRRVRHLQLVPQAGAEAA